MGSATSQPSGLLQSVSFVIPVKDEQDTLARLVDGILDATRGRIDIVQIICVDDGSIDRSWNVMQELASRHPGQVQALRLRRNLGKSVALEVGFGFATGDVIFTMDADLQDDPKEIPRFLEALRGGLDLVSGWKRKRRDSRVKTLSSRLFNRTTALITGVPLHDFNCGFKAYRREVVEQLSLYGELHRYIPVLANEAGFRIGEIEVEHHPRLHGVTKYGAERYMRGFLDLITVMVTTRYLQRPGHLFGGAGIILGVSGCLILSYLSVLWALGLGPIKDRPLLLLGVLLVIVSVQMISLGILGELMIRIAAPRDLRKYVSENVTSPADQPIVTLSPENAGSSLTSIRPATSDVPTMTMERPRPAE